MKSCGKRSYGRCSWPGACHKFKVYTADQKRRVTPQIKREFKRRAAIEPVIGHLKEHHRMGRNYLAHASGDAINAVLAAAGYNFRRLLACDRVGRCGRDSAPDPVGIVPTIS